VALLLLFLFLLVLMFYFYFGEGRTARYVFWEPELSFLLKPPEPRRRVVIAFVLWGSLITMLNK
jgi:hypothetical protein